MKVALPISVKGIVIRDGQIWLRKNERNEWELPGGRLEPGEQPEQTLVRELMEELGATVVPRSIISATVYTPRGSHNPDEQAGVLLVIYDCQLIRWSGEFEHIGEAGPAAFQSLSLSALDTVALPSVYRSAIKLTTKQ